MRSIFRSSKRQSHAGRAGRGFTLVEMLVAVGLVVLMLSLFAEVFSIATGTMSRQKGIAENDQRARMLTTLIRADLEARTFREAEAFPIGVTLTPEIGHDGYIHISEGSVDDDTDDVLQLTVRRP